ncbi:hypothetical protein PZA11_005165 [Diplocarpon coronariae]|uniref:RING-type E3 ubiquitin transferase n=1 Tax=Diplocarpon coronariae TaxID=2795749 RepID=A0A218YUA4_9HELO|nr:hypothetical protein JHW43_009518 [Diplocarpon mali]OWO97760.1 hypothetical protein B2J93_8871 [Marssonina coronariae]
MGRLFWYAGVSTALAGGVIVSAFNQRANFYSACVYLAQSNLCLMILINLILFIYGTFMYGLQRLCYGQLRPIEIEQLYEKSWFAITETCLAMTIFREEVGAWFLVMFVALLTGKVWGWIGDGRVEVLEQQPPANPRLFHIRLSVSLAMSVIYDLWLMRYTTKTVIQQARPNMMVMFLFELAILTSTSFATAFRYCISLIEAKVVKEQTRERLIERRREVREERAEMIRQREAAVSSAVAGEESDAAQSNAPLPSEDDVDEMDIEVPGWEAKGHWVLTLDLITDFVKLGIYISFFVILLMFYGLPIHIMRDLFMTARSFMKRLAAFVKYRQATRNMNSTYEDATVEDIQRDDTCIICREEMRPWSVTNPETPPAAPGAPPRPANTVNERTRPKKLPCGHILHLGCLKSWLERQQVCPTCRRPVVDTQGQILRGAANDANQAQGAQAPGQQDGAAGAPPQRRMRMLNLGPLRVGFGQANIQDFAQGIQQQGLDNGVGGGNARIYGLELGFPRRGQPAGAIPNPNGANSIQDQLQQLEQQITTEIRGLQVTQQELNLVQLMQVELARLRLIQDGGLDPLAANFQMPQMPQMPQLPQLGTVTRYPPFANAVPPQMSRHSARPTTAAIPSGSADLPPGVAIPEGWSLLPLERLDTGLTIPQNTAPVSGPAASEGPASTITNQNINSTALASNNTLAPTPTTNPEAHSQASSDDPPDTQSTHTPLSIAADQTINTGLDTATSSTNGHTEPAAVQQDADVLPNWGSSQLFSSGSLSGTLGDASETSTSSAAQSQPPTTVGEQSAVAPSLSTAESCAGPGTAGEGQEHKDIKGKGKAVTVEDAVDESEGS